MPAYFLLFTAGVLGVDFQTAQKQAAKLKLHENTKWLALLHLKNNHPQITDPRFILSSHNFSPKNELDETLALIFSDASTAKCRFPARYYLLNHFLNFDSQQEADKSDCADLLRYKKYVPFDEINLIYASEVLASASSMMGHSYLNAKGLNLNQTPVSHSISFFTEFDSFNPAVLIYDGLISGMNGFFIVRPHEQDLHRYSQVEGRNVWSYSLDIDDFDRMLIKLHIWELKDVEIAYLFQSYNCATLTLNILSIANPALPNEDILFVSPLDVVKAADKYGMIKKIGVELSDDWALKMLEQEVEPQLGQDIESLVFEGKHLSFDGIDPKPKRIAVEYLSHLITNEAVKENLSEQQLSVLSDIVDSHLDDSLDFDLSQFKNPLATKQDSIVTTSFVVNQDDTAIDFSFLPASHYLYGDNRQYFSESELKIGEITLRAQTQSNNIKLQSFTLYSFRSMAPSSRILPKYSGGFYMGYRQILDRSLDETGFFDLSGSIGKSARIHKDILLFSNLELGLAANTSDAFVYATPSVGAIVNVVGDSKIVFEYKLRSGQPDSNYISHSVSTEYAWFGIEDWTLRVGHSYLKTDTTHRNEVQLGLSWHF